MLIRNARIAGHPHLTDLRLMHGAVREMGVSLVKGLYESELDLAGDALCPWQGEPLPKRIRRPASPAASSHIAPGTPEPLLRWRDGQIISVITAHSAD